MHRAPQREGKGPGMSVSWRAEGWLQGSNLSEASAGEQKDSMVKEGNGASVSGKKICL